MTGTCAVPATTDGQQEATMDRLRNDARQTSGGMESEGGGWSKAPMMRLVRTSKGSGGRLNKKQVQLKTTGCHVE